MKANALDPHAGSGAASPTRRRSLVLGAGVAGAAAIAAKTLPVASDEPVAQAGQPASDTQQGYRLTQHVLRYYETTKV